MRTGLPAARALESFGALDGSTPFVVYPEMLANARVFDGLAA